MLFLGNLNMNFHLTSEILVAQLKSNFAQSIEDNPDWKVKVKQSSKTVVIHTGLR